MNRNEIVIASLYKIPQMDGQLMLDHKILKRKNMKVTRDYVEEINKNTHDNSKLMEIDEKATKKLHETIENRRVKIKEVVDLKAAVNANLVGEAMKKILKPEPKKEVKQDTKAEVKTEKTE